MAKDKVKIGIIGIGDRGVSFVYNFRLFPELAEITGIYDVNRPRLEAMASGISSRGSRATTRGNPL